MREKCETNALLLLFTCPTFFSNSVSKDLSKLLIFIGFRWVVIVNSCKLHINNKKNVRNTCGLKLPIPEYSSGYYLFSVKINILTKKWPEAAWPLFQSPPRPGWGTSESPVSGHLRSFLGKVWSTRLFSLKISGIRWNIRELGFLGHTYYVRFHCC